MQEIRESNVKCAGKVWLSWYVSVCVYEFGAQINCIILVELVIAAAAAAVATAFSINLSCEPRTQ